MARILFVGAAGDGRLNPLLGPAQWLVRLGHEVSWLTLPHPVARLAGFGIDVRTTPAPLGFPPVADAERRDVDPEVLRRFLRSRVIGGVADHIEAIRGVVREARPAIVVTDNQLYQAILAAHLEGVRWVGVATSLLLLTPPELPLELVAHIDAIFEERAAIFARHGLTAEFRVMDCVSPTLNVIFTTEALVGDQARRTPPHTLVAGPSLPPEGRGEYFPFDWSALHPDKPLVYVSFGSLFAWQPDLLETIARAAAPLGVQLVVTVGKTPRPLALPGDVLTVPVAPQLELLARARGFVTHAGANSVMEALHNGVPPLCIPLVTDQPLNAWFVARAGAGISLARGEATEERVRAALARLLADGPERAVAARVRDSYRAHDGARAAADAIAALAG